MPDLTTVEHEPDEIRDYDRYLALFKGQTENYRHIRVVFTGRDGAGKTTLCRRLQNKYVDIKLRQPTLGAILHPVWFSIDWKDKVWEHSDDHLPTKVIEKRMGAVLKKTKTPGMEDASTHSEQPSKYLKQMDEALAVKIASNVASLDAAYISLWDMGGHTSFQASHNVFISSHGVYLLVFRLTDFLRDRLETDRLKKWIRLIGTFSSVEMNAPKIKTHAPPIIFVGTFLDELKKSTTDYEKHVETIRLSISKFPELSELHFAKFCTVDNSLGNDETDLEILRDFIIESAVHQDQWDRQLPTTWLKFEMELQKAREKGTKILALAEVIEQNKSSIAPLTDEDDIKLALEYLHCTRSVVYFRGLDYVIIDPQWLADFFSILITDDQFLPKDDLPLTRDLELYKSKGELTQKLIEGLLNVNKNQAFIPFKSILLALMEKFGLIVKIRMSGTTTAYPQCSETYTIPSKLKELRNISDITGKIACLQKQNRPFTKTICFVFNDVYLPEELFQRIFSRILRKYRPTSLPTPSLEEATGVVETTEDNTVCLYSGFGCFEVDDLCRMILSMHIERSTIAVTVFSQTESQLPMDSGRRIRLSIEQIVQETLQMSNQQHFHYTHQLHCNFHLSPYDTPVHLYGVINSERGVPCKGGECKGQHHLSRIDTTYWGITEDGSLDQDKGVASGMKDDMNLSNRRPTPRELGRLSRLVEASRCEMLFVSLGLPFPDVEHTKWESRSLAGITLITKMFLKWTNIYPNQTFLHIKQAMMAVDMATDHIDDVLETDHELQDQDIVPEDVRTRVPSDEEIKIIVANIGNTFFNLCLELGLPPPVIEQHELGHPVTFQSRMCALLRCWREKFQTKATIGRLLTAMKMCQMDWHTTAQILLTCTQNTDETNPRQSSWIKCSIV